MTPQNQAADTTHFRPSPWMGAKGYGHACGDRTARILVIPTILVDKARGGPGVH